MTQATRAVSPPSSPQQDIATQRVVVQGRNLAMQLCVLIKTARIHDVGNVAFHGPLVSFIDTVDQLYTAEGELKLQAVGDYLYLNHNRLKVDASSYGSYQYLIDEFRNRGLSGFSFTGKLTPPEVKKFVRLFLDVDTKSSEPYEDFSSALSKLSVEHLVPMRTIVPQSGAINIEEARDSRKVAKRTFYRAIEATKTVMISVRDRRPVDLRKAKRAVQSIVDLILNEEFSLLGLTAIKNHDEYTFQHCVNVSILAISLGQRLGLSKKMLGELGVDEEVYAEVGSPIAARVVRLLASAGDRVGPDQALVELQSVELGKARADYLAAMAKARNGLRLPRPLHPSRSSPMNRTDAAATTRNAPPFMSACVNTWKKPPARP